MNKLKQHPQKKKIMASIVRFFAPFRAGDQFRTEDIIKYVKRDLGVKYIYGDSILRYARLLKQKGTINYICTNRRDRIIKVL